MRKTVIQCHCGLLTKFVNDDEVPIHRDSRSGHYSLHLTAAATEELSYCFLCGGCPGGLERRKCECHELTRWAAVKGSCVRYDPQINEYHLVYGDRCRLVFHYCPRCGGRLPSSKRARLFMRSARSERVKFEEKLGGARSLDQVIEILGRPDQRQTAMTADLKEMKTYGAVSVKAVIRYTRISRTLNVVAQELENGTIQIFYLRKPRSG